MKTTSPAPYVPSRRNQAAQLASKLGVIPLIEALAKRDSLLVLNYHRVGNKESEQFDELVYSATAGELEQQVRYLKEHFKVVTLSEAVNLSTGESDFRGPAVLITFDDGYIDNYRIAFPIFKKLGVQATFFLVSSYLKNPAIPWWDRIAYCVRESSRNSISLTYPETAVIPLPAGRRAQEIRRVVDLYKLPSTIDTDRFMYECERACEPYAAMPGQRLFLNLEDARDMVGGGMGIGSHTATHRILSKLPEEEQLAELAGSKTELEKELEIKVDTLAYPVGIESAFNGTTMSLLGKTGYRAAFSFYGGINTPSSRVPFDIKRIGADTGNPLSRFRLQIAGTIAGNGRKF